MGNLMKTCLLLAAALGANAATIKPTTTSGEPPAVVAGGSRIVGGVAAPITSFPYQLSFRVYNSHICGASIISANWALTAAHCINYLPMYTTLKAGSSDRLVNGTIHQVKNITVHPQYNKNMTDYDLALVEVAIPFKLGTPGIAAIALPALNATVATNANATVSGWGYTVGGGTVLPVPLQAVNVTMVAQATCAKTWSLSKNITDRMICAGGTPKGGTGACQGDSGGPLVVVSPTKVKELVGVVSWGSPCAKPNVPDVYARVANMRTWIKTVSGV